MESIMTGLMTTLIGMGGIFAVLAVLAIITVTLNKIVLAAEGKKKGKKQAPADQAQPVAQAKPVISVEEGISPKVVAAIMAAISATSNAQTLKFVAIRRNTPTIQNVWTSSGTNEIITTRQQYI